MTDKSFKDLSDKQVIQVNQQRVEAEQAAKIRDEGKAEGFFKKQEDPAILENQQLNG